MKWKTIRRETGLIEHVCEHGVGHPNVGSMARLDEIYGPGSAGTWGVHGCDGCCGLDDFPGSAVNTLRFVKQFYTGKVFFIVGAISIEMHHAIDQFYLSELTDLYEVDIHSIFDVITEAVSGMTEIDHLFWRQTEEMVYWVIMAIAKGYR